MRARGNTGIRLQHILWLLQLLIILYTDDVHLKDGTVMPMLNYVYPESLVKPGKALQIM